MSKPWIHAKSSAKIYGGKPEDYLEIHNLMDSSKAALCDNRHRALTHNAWFIGHILEKIFGVTFTNSDGKVISVRDIGEQHVAEDFGNKYIPTAQDYLEHIEFQPWMNNGKNGCPSSFRKFDEVRNEKKADPPKISKHEGRPLGAKPVEPDPSKILEDVLNPNIPEMVVDGSNAALNKSRKIFSPQRYD